MAGCKRKYSLAAALACLLWAGFGGGLCKPLSASAQSAYRFKSRAEIEAALDPELMENAGKLLKFDKTTVCLDTMLCTDGPKTVSFQMTNVSGKTLQIGMVTTTCGCTEAAVDKKPMAPGEQRTIKVTFDPRESIGTIDTRIFVYLASSVQSPAGKLTLTGLVKDANPWSHLPVSMGDLKLKRKTVTFSDVRAGQHREVRILCGNSGSSPLKVHSELLPPYLKLRSEPAVIAPGEEADLVLTLDGSALENIPEKGITLQIVVDGVKGRPMDRMIAVQILPMNKN